MAEAKACANEADGPLPQISALLGRPVTEGSTKTVGEGHGWPSGMSERRHGRRGGGSAEGGGGDLAPWFRLVRRSQELAPIETI